MKQGSLDFIEDIKIFKPRDFFFNNGIVNLYHFCEKNQYNIDIHLYEHFIEIETNDEIYKTIFTDFIKENKIIRKTKLNRLYFNEISKEFLFDNKYEIIGAASGNDIKNSYITKTPEELGLTKEVLQEKYLNFCSKKKVVPDLKEKIGDKKVSILDNIKKELNIVNKKFNDEDKLKIISYLSYHKEFLNVPDGNNIVTVYPLEDDLIKNAMDKYFVKENPLKMDSKIHPFETKNKTQFDLLKPQPKYHKIDKWEALIYWFGSRTQRYFSQHKKIESILLPNSSNLKSLYILKKDLEIPTESIRYKNKNENIVDTRTNIDFYNQLSKDEIKKIKFYESKSIEELELKFFMFLFSKIYHIEKGYQDLVEDEELALLFDENTFSYSKMLFDSVQDISFVAYSFDKNFKYSLNEYTKAYKLMMFFLKLKENDLFSYFGELIYQISICKKRKLREQKEAYNNHLIRFSKAILNFQSVVKIIFDVSYDILQTDEENKKSGLYNRLGFKFYNFLKLYQKIINKGEDMSLHSESKKLGQQIGDFTAKHKDKDLLFKIRNIKNFKQFIAFIRDVEFKFLQQLSEDNKGVYLNTKKVLELLDVESENWDLMKDYVAIYAIEQFKYRSYKEKK